MRFLYSFLILLFFSSFSGKQLPAPLRLEGLLLEGTSGRPVAEALLFTVKGEEETLTDAKGFFTLQTWEKLPLTLTIHHPSGKEGKLEVQSAEKPLRINWPVLSGTPKLPAP